MGQLVRQGGRIFAIFFSDVIVWLSVAGVFEVLFVLLAGVLCILTAGFIFEGMKRHPLVMVLGTALALTGAFLVLREVRGFFVSTTPTVAAPAKPSNSLPPPSWTGTTPKPVWPPKTTLTPSPFDLPKTVPKTLPKTTLKPAKPHGADCASRGPGTCDPSHGCMWSLIYNRCKSLSGSPIAKPAAPARLDDAWICIGQPKTMCAIYAAKCYWSSLTNRCEKLRIGGGFFSKAQPSAPTGIGASCSGKMLLDCLSAAGCKWSSTLKTCNRAP